MLTKKHTAWKKNRKLGDVYGGRTFPKLSDKLFNRQHNLAAPTSTEETPIYIFENPSRDFYFPVTIDEIKLTLSKLPKEHTEHLTHIWLQKIKKSDYLNGDTFQGCFICGSNVYLIVLHPFPTDNKMRFGKTKPENKNLNYYKKYSIDLQQDDYGWFLQWTEETIKDYYLMTFYFTKSDILSTVFINDIGVWRQNLKKKTLPKIMLPFGVIKFDRHLTSRKNGRQHWVLCKCGLKL